MAKLEFWYEFASTYSYPAAMRIEDLAGQKGVEVVWMPFLLGPIFREQGWENSPFNEIPAKGDYMWRDLERTCERLGLGLRRPDPFPQNSLLASRVAKALPDNRRRAAFSRAVYSCEFEEGGQISEPDVLADLLETLGEDADVLLDQASNQGNKDALKSATALAKEFGLFGAPTFRTSDGEIFWGNDRLEEALDWTKKL
ncbi:MAG: 2-hydroxychromene-2-carboxylate isomerase [Pseudomonadota bacterium]